MEETCLARRLKTVVTHLIHDDPKGFLKGRYSGETLGSCTIHYCILVNTAFLVSS